MQHTVLHMEGTMPRGAAMRSTRGSRGAGISCELFPRTSSFQAEPRSAANLCHQLMI